MFTFPVFSRAIAIKKHFFSSYLHWDLPPPFTMRLRDDLASKPHQRCVKAQRNRTDLRLRVSVGFYNHGSYSWDVLLLDWIFQSCLTTDREAFGTKSNGGLKGKPVSVLLCFKYFDFFIRLYQTAFGYKIYCIFPICTTAKLTAVTVVWLERRPKKNKTTKTNKQQQNALYSYCIFRLD